MMEIKLFNKAKPFPFYTNNENINYTTISS